MQGIFGSADVSSHANEGDVGSSHQQSRLRPGTRAGLHVDFNVPAQQQKAQQPFDGKSRQPTAHQRRYFGLVHSKNRGGIPLSEPSCLDDGNNLLRQLRFDERFVRLRQSKIGKDVSGSLYIVAFRHVHFSRSAFNSTAGCSRRFTSSISALGSKGNSVGLRAKVGRNHDSVVS